MVRKLERADLQTSGRVQIDRLQLEKPLTIGERLRAGVSPLSPATTCLTCTHLQYIQYSNAPSNLARRQRGADWARN